MACGNGLRPEVWLPFQERFRIPRILEYYASTEGNFSLYNCEGQPGAIGRIPPVLGNRLPVALLRFDVEKSEAWRNGQGFCEPCATNEIGEAVGFMPGDSGQRVVFDLLTANPRNPKEGVLLTLGVPASDAGRGLKLMALLKQNLRIDW